MPGWDVKEEFKHSMKVGVSLTFFQRAILNVYMTIQRFFNVYFYSLTRCFYFWEFSCRNNQTIQRFQERGVIILSLLRQEARSNLSTQL